MSAMLFSLQRSGIRWAACAAVVATVALGAGAAAAREASARPGRARSNGGAPGRVRSVDAVPAEALSASASPAVGAESPPSVQANGGAAEPEGRFNVRVGVLYLHPLVKSSEVVLSNVSGSGQLAVQNGPVRGSAVGVDPTTILAVTVGWNFHPKFALETILAAPVSVRFTAKGTLATQSMASDALGNLPTGVPPLGENLGEAKALPPVLTVVWRPRPDADVRPFLGAGASYMYTYDARITNEFLSAVRPPKLSIPGKLGWVAQAGVDVRLWQKLFLTVEAKYIGGLNMSTQMKDLEVAVPGLPLFEAARVGDASIEMALNPLIVQSGVGWTF